MKENVLNLVAEIDMQVQEVQSPKQDGCKRPTPRHIRIKMPKGKHKERILKISKGKDISYLQGSFHKSVS